MILAILSLLWWGIVVLLLTGGALTAYAAWRGAPYVPTPRRAVEAALDLADVGSRDVVVDLGAGDGRVVVAAARRGARAIGYELSPFLWVVAKLRVVLAGVAGDVRLGDALSADLSGRSVVFLFLIPRTLGRVSNDLFARLSPGTRVVSYVFPLPERVPHRVVRPPGCGPILLYVVPAGGSAH